MRKLTLGLIGGLAALVLAVAPATAGGGGAKVKVDNYSFSPQKVKVGKGGKVTWKNVEGKHTVTFKDGNFDKVLKGDEKVSRKFKDRGTFKYICRFHKDQGQKGKVVVG
jgi:plastocyanin